MQSSRLSSFPTVYPSFQRHRKSIDHSRFTLNLSLCSVNNTPAWGPLPTPPMSGSPPPEPTKDLSRGPERDPSQLAGRRRKRSDTPPTTTGTPATSTFPALVEHNVLRYGDQSTSDRRHEELSMQIAHQPIPYLPSLAYGTGPVAPVPQYTVQEGPSPHQQISPRTTRKTKAHVASACINCKKKHLRCDNSRPCRRCVQSGKEDTCRDVEHKKRGRPPLKPEDPTVIGRRAPGPTPLGTIAAPSGIQHATDPRSYASSIYPPILPNALPSMYGHSRSGSRNMLYGGLQPSYAAPSIAPSHLTATAGAFSYGSRPQSTPAVLATQPLSPYNRPPPYGDQRSQRPMQSYANYTFQPIDLAPSTQPLYSNPIFPRDQQGSHTPGENPYAHGLQLPPIRPTQPGMLDPSIPQRSPRQQSPAQSHSREQRRQSGERETKRPKMDIQGILGPKNE